MSLTITALASAALVILTPYLTKAGEKVAEKIGESVFNLVKSKFSGDKDAEDALRLYQKNPAVFEGALTQLIEAKLKEDPDFEAQLREMVAQADADTGGSVSQVAIGSNIAQATHGGTASVNVNQPPQDEK
ncbi:MAG: hypothetical protein JW953_09600 [Anaerolineae bacterium]|nr:hypothetical protein [Anaerolineae bacterium]